MANLSGPADRVADTLIIGCGNLLRGDDAVGPVLIRHLWELGLPDDVRCADGGTGGMDVAFQMRGVRHVILVDACVSGSEPGSLFCLPSEAVEHLPPLEGINLHAFRWDHALAFAHWLLKEDYPQRITVYLIEAKSLVIGDPLSPPVDEAMRKLATLLLHQLSVRSEAVELTHAH
jgi:hydrogenase maturation protease